MKFKEFMLQNAIQIENEKYVVSERFRNDDGKPMEWELKVLTKLEEEEILKACYRTVERGNRVTTEFDEILYRGKVVAGSVVSPKLNNMELQNAYGVMSGDQLLKAMLTATEYNALHVKINLMGRSKVSLDEKVEQAKK